MSSKFSENLQLLLEEKNLTQKMFANEIAVSQSTVSDWLSGNKEPGMNRLIAVADYFGVEIDVLVGRKEF